MAGSGLCPSQCLTAVVEENEHLRIRARLQQPANMRELERRIRTVLGFQGTEKGRALEEKFVKKGGG